MLVFRKLVMENDDHKVVMLSKVHVDPVELEPRQEDEQTWHLHKPETGEPVFTLKYRDQYSYPPGKVYSWGVHWHDYQKSANPSLDHGEMFDVYGKPEAVANNKLVHMAYNSAMRSGGEKQVRRIPFK